MATVTKGHEMKDEMITSRMTRRLYERIVRVANRDGQALGEWMRIAAVERLNREEKRGDGNGA